MAASGDSLFVDLKGLEDLRESLDFNKLSKELSFGLGRQALKLHSAIQFEVATRYNMPARLDSVWENKNNSTRKIGQSVFETTLVYRYRNYDLSKFDPTWEWGNINSWATRPGRVHSVTVKRPLHKIVYGKDHFGGFIPRTASERNKAGRAIKGSPTTVNRYSHGAQMFERTGPDRDSPLRVLYGPTLAQLAGYLFDHNIGTIGPAVQDFEDYIKSVIAKIGE